MNVNRNARSGVDPVEKGLVNIDES